MLSQEKWLETKRRIEGAGHKIMLCPSRDAIQCAHYDCRAVFLGETLEAGVPLKLPKCKGGSLPWWMEDA